RLFLESRAPSEGSSLLVGGAVALRAPVLSSLLARLRRSRPAEPTCAATPRQFRDPGRSLSWVCRSHARDERPRHETQVGRVCGQNPGPKRRMSVYSREERMKAVKLYFQYDRQVAPVLRELGYPSRRALRRWV